MDVQKSTATTIYKYDPCIGDEKLKAVFRDSKQVYAFLKYLKKRNTERIYLI